jgi:enolase
VNLETDGAVAPITDFKEACRVINEDISQLLKGKDVLALKKIDDMLLNYQKK